MTYFDEEYIKLLKRILKEGEEVENRTGINTVKLPEHYFKFDLRDEYPILSTKQTFYKNAILEMLWIWQASSNDVEWLHERNVKIWDEWIVDDDGIYRIYEPNTKDYNPDKEVTVMDPLSVPLSDPFGEYTSFEPKYNDEGKLMTAKSRIPGKNIKAAKWYGKGYAGTIGTAYGYITKRYDMARSLINSIKNCPTARRKVFSLWQNEFLRTAVLPSCVWSTEWNIYKDTLNLEVHQRSCDVPLGLPFNVTQYATLLKMIAQVTDLEPGFVSYSINEPHIYVNQLDGIKEQLRRAETYEYLNSRLPNVGDYVTTDDGLKGEVSSVSVLRQMVKVLVEVDDEKEIRDYSVDQLKFKPKRRRDHVKLTAQELKELSALEDKGGKSKIDDAK